MKNFNLSLSFSVILKILRFQGHIHKHFYNPSLQKYHMATECPNGNEDNTLMQKWKGSK